MGLRVILIDDSTIVRGMLKKVLNLSGLRIQEILEAANGQEALQHLTKGSVDLIFLDINMPVMNGMEFMEIIRKDENLKNLPVVVVSTEGSQDRVNRMKDLNVLHYLRKPVTPEHLSSTIKNLFGRIHG